MDRKRPVDTHIGQRLKEYRQHRGMTVRELADAAHVTPGQISRYEHGRDRISHERVIEFARILRIKSNDLYQPPGSRLRRNHAKSFSQKPHGPPRGTTPSGPDQAPAQNLRRLGATSGISGVPSMVRLGRQ
jgi:transcriptional regulator with XRE-family HTH domain